mmetsp:Transcript_95951/g.200465  ORF Transcript_95951/g.200465 Transcript_95951/m.200465 type:complete len:222 (+) Transcript_95951:41-706(+)
MGASPSSIALDASSHGVLHHGMELSGCSHLAKASSSFLSSPSSSWSTSSMSAAAADSDGAAYVDRRVSARCLPSESFLFVASPKASPVYGAPHISSSSFIDSEATDSPRMLGLALEETLWPDESLPCFLGNCPPWQRRISSTSFLAGSSFDPDSLNNGTGTSSAAKLSLKDKCFAGPCPPRSGYKCAPCGEQKPIMLGPMQGNEVGCNGIDQLSTEVCTPR